MTPRVFFFQLTEIIFIFGHFKGAGRVMSYVTNLFDVQKTFIDVKQGSASQKKKYFVHALKNIF